MLQNLREHAQGWIAGVVVGILCLAFALWGVEYYLSGGPKDNVVAKVNGEKITQQQLDISYKRYRQMLAASNPTSVDETLQKQVKEKILKSLITNAALLQAAKKEGYVLSPQQVGALIQQMPEFQEDGKFSPKLFQRIVAEFSYSPLAFFNEIEKSALVLQPKVGIAASNFALPNEIKNSLKLQSQKRDIQYFVISSQAVISNTPISDADIQNYYKGHSDQFKTPEEISLQYIELSPEEIAKQVSVSTAELKQYYEENKAAFRLPFDKVKDQVKQSITQQKAERLFAEKNDKLTNLTYTHPDSLKFAADALGTSIKTTPFFTRQSSVANKSSFISNPKIISIAFSDNVLKQRNNSDIISLSDQQFVVIRIADYKAEQIRPLSEVATEIRQILQEKSAEKAAKSLGEEIVNLSRNGVSLDAIMNKNKLVWAQKQNVQRATQDVPSEVLNLAFSLSKSETDKKSSIGGKFLPDGRYAVVMLKNIKEDTSRTLNAKDQDKLEASIASDFGVLDYDLYVAQVLNDVKIK